MKAVMISIQPKMCELILNGEKTIEVRKTRPNIETPFKCYIYCTGGRVLVDNESMIYRQSKTRLIKRKVCKGWLKNKPEETTQILLDYEGNFPIYNGDYELNGKIIGSFICDKIEKFTVGTLRCDDIEKAACLTYAEMIERFYKPNELYGNTAKFGYAWYITDLKIYDKPKDLGEFFIFVREISSGWLTDYCEYKNYLTRPPQSWQYCEELEENKNG